MVESTLDILIQRFGPNPHVLLSETYDLLGYSTNSAAQRAAWDFTLGVATYRLRNSQKAPRFVSLVALAEYIDAKQAAAAEEYARIIEVFS